MFIAIVDLLVAAENRPAALASLQGEATAVRAMAGNLAFRFFIDPMNASAIRIFHEWQDAAGFESYTASGAFSALGRTLRPLLTAAPVSRRMTAQHLETVR